MTRDEIIRMAQEARLEPYGPTGICPGRYGPYVETLERFAALVAAAEREACMQRIDGLIKPGSLPGNGLDQTAQRNGLVLAYNALHARGEPGA